MFIILELDGGEWSTSCTSHLNPSTHLIGGWALKWSKNKKTCKRGNLNTEMFKCGLHSLIKSVLLHLYNVYWRREKEYHENGQQQLWNLFKKKSYRSNHENYRGLLMAAYKMHSKIITQWINETAKEILLEEWSGFRKGSLYTDDVILKQIMG